MKPVSQGARPGGRSLRVQNAVHAAVRALMAETGHAGLGVPQIAQRAGVTPSTIYRRWGDLATLVHDVARNNLRSDCPLLPTGHLANDLAAWAEMYQEEMDSVPGRAMLRDLMKTWNGHDAACNLLGTVRMSVEAILQAASPPSPLTTDAVLDTIVAPVLMRLIFTDAPLAPGLARRAAETLARRADIHQDA